MLEGEPRARRGLLYRTAVIAANAFAAPQNIWPTVHRIRPFTIRIVAKTE